MILINETAHLLREREQLMISFGGKMGGGEGGGGEAEVPGSNPLPCH